MIAALLLLFSGYCSPRQRWPRGGVVAIVALLLWGGAQAQTASAPTDAEVQPIPALSGRVIDQTGDTLSIEQRQALSRQLAEVEAQTGSQMVILLVKRTAPEDIAAYAWRVADAWKIGRRDVGDGVLIVVARDDRRVRIEVAKALEGAIPDLAARQIIDQVVRPAFRTGQYAQGLQATVEALRQRLRGEVPPPGAPTARDDEEAVDGVFLLFVVAMVAVASGRVLSSIMGRTGASWVSGAVAPMALHRLDASWWVMVLGALVAFAVVRLRLADRGTSLHANPSGSRSSPIVTGGWDSGSSSDSGGSFDSFSSGGGGDFGGGGASGDW